MRSIRRGVVLAALAVAFVAAIPAGAQAQAFIAASAGISGFSGDDFDGVDAGFAAGAALGTRVGGGNFSIAGLFGYSTHGISDTDASVDAVSIEAQGAIRLGPDDGDSVNGLAIGPVVGASVPLGGSASAGVAGNWSILSLSDDVSGSKWGAALYILLNLGGS